MQLLEAFSLAQAQIYFAKVQPNVKAATELLRPVLRSPISQVLISFVVGYYATNKIVQVCAAALKRGFKSDKVEDKKTNEVSEANEDQSDFVWLTLQQLMTYDGLRINRPVYTALNGKIYDLSSAREQFAPQGPYSLLAGCDANQVLDIACGSMGVSADDVVQRWEQSLNAEFQIVGYLIDSGAEVTRQEVTRQEVTAELESQSDLDDDDGSTVVDGQSEAKTDELFV